MTFEPTGDYEADFATLENLLNEEEARWQKMNRTTSMIQSDTLDLACKVNILITFLANSEIIDHQMFNLQVLSEKLTVIQRMRAQLEEHRKPSPVIVAPASMARELRKGKGQL